MRRRPERSIAARLLGWYDAGHRDLPWRRTRDPYRIWVSEIMLQQTRAEAVIPYYERFLKRFPRLASLARASEADVLKCWSGLGYYTRARHLHQAARRMGGAFPAGYEALRDLPGVGDYTAAAIASIAFGEAHAAVDGNALRVIARLTNDAADIGAGRTRTRFRAIAGGWLDRRRPGDFNQALMELGATVCVPRAPHCGRCPLAALCAARREGRAGQLPVKLRRQAPVKATEALVIVKRRGRILMWQRAAGSGRLAGFWELPSLSQLPQLRAPRVIGVFRHTITHHHYEVTVHVGSGARAVSPLRWVPIATLESLLLSTVARKAFEITAGGIL